MIKLILKVLIFIKLNFLFPKKNQYLLPTSQLINPKILTKMTYIYAHMEAKGSIP